MSGRVYRWIECLFEHIRRSGANEGTGAPHRCSQMRASPALVCPPARPPAAPQRAPRLQPLWQPRLAVGAGRVAHRSGGGRAPGQAVKVGRPVADAAPQSNPPNSGRGGRAQPDTTTATRKAHVTQLHAGDSRRSCCCMHAQIACRCMHQAGGKEAGCERWRASLQQVGCAERAGRGRVEGASACVCVRASTLVMVAGVPLQLWPGGR